jgi:hypothetical protein
MGQHGIRGIRFYWKVLHVIASNARPTDALDDLSQDAQDDRRDLCTLFGST